MHIQINLSIHTVAAATTAFSMATILCLGHIASMVHKIVCLDHKISTILFSNFKHRISIRDHPSPRGRVKRPNSPRRRTRRAEVLCEEKFRVRRDRNCRLRQEGVIHKLHREGRVHQEEMVEGKSRKNQAMIRTGQNGVLVHGHHL